ncbi:MAG: sterol desaturase family protein [Nitrospira sp.]|jgi:sterol desaturase/sphingolipid hydroxylase (fatty acid hydroxylase superfamily)|nr:sterol desaturase family protein [Nitrospira sp.]
MASQDLIRMGSYLSVLGVMAMWEWLAPRRPLTASKFCRWGGNLTIVALNTVIARLLFSGGVVAMAALAQERGWGLLNWVDGPAWLEMGLAVVLLDFIIYWQHQVFHLVPILWRFHMMHHSDLDLDVSSGVRFHPVEMVFSLLVKSAAVLVLGVAPLAVVAFEIVLNATALFNHSNVRMPLGLDRALRWVIVTPDMHRIHHSTDRRETNSNYGFNVPWWDRLFGTYCAEPALGQLGMKIGLEHLGPPVCLNLFMMLRFPFVATLGRYAGRTQA